ncbi:uncharacterized protein TRIADDRAFT_25328 [Trichoplax adhaerens]|uniref:G-protein coupled receptors family 3 profile domain-containing protein n=1 Tax=Trichoplax adhaerens TaxID=10228 RepID=B3RWY5_TRIAD|nr:hypothetical protein TRIADDRAFT_25328 [Trichoplax adhaerens]EDV24776.1 hypothetical protein TRIADDRAFT_25328 [Trichoplax adhaerens]|eukprot:XP_002112666.1 hypothetical protein TRIADDRAFT_25328 [Trichoplax adhaerens]
MNIERVYNSHADKYIPNYDVKMKRVLAIIYSIEMVNKNKHLLPNVSLGYDMRDYCSCTRVALTQSFDFVKSFSATNCDEKYSQDHAAIMGTETSKDSIAVATLIGDYHIPMVSYFSSSHILSDTVRFKTFFRTIPSDINQAKALVKLVKYFGWNYVALVAVTDSYGDALASSFSAMASTVGICIPIHRIISTLDGKNQIRNIVQDIAKNDKVNVILLMVTLTEAKLFIEELYNQNVTGKTLVGCDAWIGDKLLRIVNHIYFDQQGVIGLTFSPNYIDDFERYLANINLCQQDNNVWLQEYQRWRNWGNPLSRHCKLPRVPKVRVNSSLLDESAAGNIIDGVYAIAYSLHKLLNCSTQYCPYIDFRHFPRMKFIKILRKITFPGLTASRFRFDINGDRYTDYSIANIQKHPTTGRFYLRAVGRVGNDLQIKADKDKFVWNFPLNDKDEIDSHPKSRCSEDCQPGTYRDDIETGGCCWNCKPCPDNYYSNQTNSPLCHACLLGFKSNANRSECIKVNITNLSLRDPLVIFLFSFLVAAVLLTAIIWIMMCYYRHTPVVKASNFPLTNLLLFSLMCIYIAPAVNLMPQSKVTCTVMSYSFSLALLLTLAIITARAHLLSRLFITKPWPADRNRLLNSNKGYVVLIIGVMIIAVILLIFLNYIDPLYVERYISPTNVAYPYCYSKNSLGVMVFSAIQIVMDLLCIYYAFKIRKIPSNFNEARYIFFASLIMCMLFITVLSASFVEHGPYETAIQVIGVTLISLSTTLCIFAPKIYVIYYDMEFNVKKNAIAAIVQYSFQDNIFGSRNASSGSQK